MWKTALRGVLARKLRFLLTGFAVAIGVAFMVGTLTFTQSIINAFDGLFATVNQDVDAAVRGKEPFESDFGENRKPIPGELLEVVAGVDGVRAAAPGAQVYAQLVDAEGDPIGGTAAPTFGFVWNDYPELNPMRLLPGSEPPRNADEIVIDKGSADEADLRVGDRVQVLTQQAPKEYTIVGIARFGDVDSPLGASVTVFEAREAQRIAGAGNVWADVSVVAEDGISQKDIRDRIEQAVEDYDVEVVTGEELIAEAQDEVREGLGFFRTGLLAFSFIALFVACFIIYNIFSITVAQRSRELALLRAIGASRAQVSTAVLGESLLVGLGASVLGIAGGFVVAVGLRGLLSLVFGDLPTGAPALTVGIVLTAFAVGCVVTVASATLPAVRAARVPPVAALRDVAFERRVRRGVRAAWGFGVAAVSIAILFFGLVGGPSNAIFYVAGGALGVLAAVIVIGPLLARPVSRFLGAPLPRLKGMTGTLARENATRNPRRTSATAAALMIGVALVGFITIFAASLEASIFDAIDEQFQADFIVTGGTGGFGGVGLSPELARELGELPELSAVTGVRFGAFQVGEDTEFVTAADPVASEQLFDFGAEEGAFSDLTAEGIGISREVADDKGLQLGDDLAAVFAKTGPATLRVEMIYGDTEAAGPYLMSLTAYEQFFTEQLDFQVAARIADGVSADEARVAMEPIVEQYPTAKLQDQAEYKADTAGQIQQVTNLVYGLLFLSIVIALIGISITLALSILERTRELGLLRAVGMGRGQVRSTVRWESVIISLFGTVLGLGVGLFFGWAVVFALRDEGFSTLDIAPANLAVVVLVGVLVGILASVWPARRAARLDVLEAITTE